MDKRTRNEPVAGDGMKSWGAPLAVLLVFAWMMIFATRASNGAGLPLVLVVLYLLFAAASVIGIGSAIKLHRILGVVAAVAVSPVFVWQFREVVRLPDAKAHIPLACLGAAVALYGVSSLCVRLPLRRLIASAAVTTVCFVVLLGLSFSLSPDLRWHLVKWHTVFGFPAHLALGPGVEDVRGQLWTERFWEGAATVVSSPLPPTDGSSPTIVFVILDTLRRDSLSAYGGAAGLMPKLNAMVQESLVFEDVLVNASWTRPSIASMFTGLYQEHHGAVGRADGLRPEVDTVASVLSRRGYETAAFVANWAVIGKDAGFDRGFDRFLELRSDSHPYLRADGVTREVLRWVRARSGAAESVDRPLFLYVHYLDPHLPYLSGGADSTVFSIARRAYDNEVTFLDGHVAELLRSLETEIAGPVVTIVAADHGEEFGEHGQKGHGYTLYEEVARVPVFVRTPARAAGVIDARLEGRDLFDLILSASKNTDFDPVVWARSRDRTQRYTSEYLSSDVPFYRLQYRDVCMRAVEHDGRFLIWSALGPTVEVYDRETDPLEARNLATQWKDRLPDMLDELDRLAPAPWAPREPIRLSPETEQQLRALGYID